MSVDTRTVWSHDEQKYISSLHIKVSKVFCRHCGSVVNKYIESHYTGGKPCVLLAKYCRHCGKSLI